MKVEVFDSKMEMAKAAANSAANIIRQALKEREVAYVIAATGASQFEFLDALVLHDLDWSRTVFFHLDDMSAYRPLILRASDVI